MALRACEPTPTVVPGRDALRAGAGSEVDGDGGRPRHTEDAYELVASALLRALLFIARAPCAAGS